MADNSIESQGTELVLSLDGTTVLKFDCPTALTGIGFTAGEIPTNCLDSVNESSRPGRKKLNSFAVPFIVQEGSATIDVDGKALALAKDQAIYLQPGSVRSMKAGANGLVAIEAYSPVRLDHLAMAGQKTSGVNVGFPDQGVTPSLPPGGKR